jgi:calcium-dependent protein kinase
LDLLTLVLFGNLLGVHWIFQALPEEYLPRDVTEPGKLDEMFEKTDANNDGQISFEEFKDAIQANNFLQDAVLYPMQQQT